jgi:hypothetical protein
MCDDYLWDRSGTPDPEIVRLEQVLGPLAWRKGGNRGPAVHSRLGLVRSKAFWSAIAAVLVMGVAWEDAVGRAQASFWELSLQGQKPVRVLTGERIQVSAPGGAFMRERSTGEVRIEVNSVLRLVSARKGQQNIALERGVIHALIWAPPAQFVVDTPSAKAVDLGCQYTLRVGQNGNGFLTVEVGWVAFQHGRTESFIPAGAACATDARRGPGIPYFADAPDALKSAVKRFDADGDFHAIEAALPLARTRDGLTLWHLLQRTRGSQRERVWERFTELVGPAKDIREDAIVHGDEQAMSGAWNALERGDAGWWREWKRRW